MIERSQAVLMALLLLSGCGASDEAPPQARATPAATPTPTPPIPTAQAPARWASSDNLRITVNETDGTKHDLTRDRADFKPSWSKTGSMLTFLRARAWGGGFDTWKPRLSVVESDGNNFRELTNGLYA